MAIPIPQVRTPHILLLPPVMAGCRISKALVQTHQTCRHGPLSQIYYIIITLVTMLHINIDDTKDKPEYELSRKIMF
jgi:hypothetical protein